MNQTKVSRQPINLHDAKIVVIGLGYVRLPLTVEFGKQLPTLGFDINTARIAELKTGFDRTLETTAEELVQARHLHYTDSAEDLQRCNV